MRLLVKKLSNTAKLPEKKRNEDEGWDIFSDETINLDNNKATKISTGIACGIENITETINVSTKDDYPPHRTEEKIIDSYWLQIEGRSGLASKGIFPIAGVLDNCFFGEIQVVLVNLSGSTYTINKGDKIAQFVVRKHYDPKLVEVDDLGNSDRGEQGFGSSGYR